MPDKEVLETFDSQKIKTQAADALIKASTLTVNDTESWHQAREIRRMAKLLDSTAKKHYEEIKKPINEMRANILKVEKKDREPMSQVLELLDPRILTYEEHEEALRAGLQKALEAEAVAQARAVREGQIKELLENEQIERAEELAKKPLFIPPAIVPESREFLEGEGRLETWFADREQFDLKKLAQAFLDGRVPASVLCPDWTVLDGMAKALKETFSIPGVTARKKRSITQR